MQQHIQHIRHELSELYTSSEIAVLTRLILEEVCSVPFGRIMADKINHLSRLQNEKLEGILFRLKGESHTNMFSEKQNFMADVSVLTLMCLFHDPKRRSWWSGLYLTIFLVTIFPGYRNRQWMYRDNPGKRNTVCSGGMRGTFRKKRLQWLPTTLLGSRLMFIFTIGHIGTLYTGQTLRCDCKQSSLCDGI